MSMTTEELEFVQGLAEQVQSLRAELLSWQNHAEQIKSRNVQLSQQISILNAENARLADWVEQTFKVVQRAQQAQQAQQAEGGTESDSADLVNLLSRTLNTFKT